MNWFQKISVKMSVSEALQELGFSSDVTPSMDELKNSWKRLIMKFHPDRNPGDESAALRAVRINNAYDVLKNFSFPGNLGESGQNTYQSWSPSRSREIPEWQTDERSSYNKINEDSGRKDINYCKWEIWNYAKERGPLEKWTFWAFDGRFFRGVFTVKANMDSLDFGGEVMEDWNSKGGNPYSTDAVFANKRGQHDLWLVRLHSRPMTGKNVIFTHDSFNMNPGNDKQFVESLRRYVRENA